MRRWRAMAVEEASLVRRTSLAGEIFSIGQPWRNPPWSASLRGRPRKLETTNRYGNGLLPPNGDHVLVLGPFVVEKSAPAA